MQNNRYPLQSLRCSDFFINRMYVDTFQCVSSLISVCLQSILKYPKHLKIMNRGSILLLPPFHKPRHLIMEQSEYIVITTNSFGHSFLKLYDYITSEIFFLQNVKYTVTTEVQSCISIKRSNNSFNSSLLNRMVTFSLILF